MELSIGLIVDIHGKTTQEAVKTFNDYDLAGVLVNGDVRGYDGKFYPIVKELNECNSPVYMLPGSHDLKNEWEKISDYSNLINMADYKKIRKIGNYSLVGNPGSTWVPENVRQSGQGFIINPDEDVTKLFVYVQKNVKNDFILQSHEPAYGFVDVACYVETISGRRPGRYKVENGEIRVEQGATVGSVGNEMLTTWINGETDFHPKPKITTCGHIHESYVFQSPGMNTDTGEPVQENEQTERLVINPGPWIDGRLAIIYSDYKQVEYEIITIK